ncbi:MAG: hypothetical protein JWR35_1059 [Marmoricola sp.]|jgi:hypothetical protein|nr:hypothetical protein [Marmoricola sp.]
MSSYDVVLLIEQALSVQDIEQVRGLHESIEDPVRYHVILPVEDAAVRIESAMGSLATGEMLASPSMVMGTDVQDIQNEILATSRGELKATIQRMQDAGATAVGDTVSIDPIDALRAKVAEVSAAEAIILTRPHVVSEFFHLDWTSRARRKLGVPVLHLLEQENFDEQSGEGEGITGL